MGEETETKLIELIAELVQQGEDRVTTDDLEGLEERIGERLERLEGQLVAIEAGQKSHSGRIGRLETTQARQAQAAANAATQRLSIRELEREGGKAEHLVALRIPGQLGAILWRLVILVATAAAGWVAAQMAGLPTP